MTDRHSTDISKSPLQLASPRLFGGRFREALDHSGNTDGLRRGTAVVAAIDRIGSTVVRVRGRLNHPMPSEAWAITNPTVRIEIPGTGRDELVSRVYTVRDFGEAGDARHIDLDFVLHDEPSPVMAWLQDLRPGDRIDLIGPRAHVLPVLVDGRPCELLADETGIPALHTILRDWPAGAEGRAWAWARDRRVVDELPQPVGVKVEWLDAAGRRSLVDAAGAITGNPTVWGAGERTDMRVIRDDLRDRLGLSNAEMRVFGYWTRGVSGSFIDQRRLETMQRRIASGVTPDDPMAADLDIDV